MFKKSLAAVAVLGALAGSAMAAEVTMYGVVDTGLMYQYYDEADGDATTDLEQHTLGLESGLNAASRFGMKGKEDLGNGLTVGFVLENGFKSDSGEFKTGNKLFDREASVSVYSDFGTLSMGRMGGVGSSAGTYDLVYKFADAFDGGDNEVFGLASSGRSDNMITYQTPKFSGVQGTFQYSFNQNGQEQAHTRLNDKYASAAVTGEFGALNVVAAYEYLNHANTEPHSAKLVRKDGQVFHLGGNYDCGFAKTFVLAQYFQDQKELTYLGSDDGAENGFKGYGLHVGTQFPALAGNVTAGLYYVDATAENTAGDRDTDYVGASLRYAYSLSKRTILYTGAGYAQANVDATKTATKYEKDVTQVYAGLTHTF